MLRMMPAGFDDAPSKPMTSYPQALGATARLIRGEKPRVRSRFFIVRLSVCVRGRARFGARRGAALESFLPRIEIFQQQ